MERLTEYDIVEVVTLIRPFREFGGTDVVKRAPEVGDKGTIVFVYDDDNYAVESVCDDGMTIWLAEFCSNELRIASA